MTSPYVPSKTCISCKDFAWWQGFGLDQPHHHRTSRTHHRLSVWIKLQCGCIKQFTCLVGIKEVLGRPFLSEAGFEKVFRIQNWVRRSKLFCRWFLLLGQAWCCCLNPVEVTFLLFRCVWWLDCLLLKEGPLQPFAALGDCLRCFLLLRSLWVFAQVAGFHLDDCIEYFTAPYGPPCPL